MGLILDLVLACGAILIYAWVQILIFRIFRPKERWKLLKALYFLFMPLLAATVYWIDPMHLDSLHPTSEELYIAGALILLWLLFNGYVIFYAFIDRSISICTNVMLYQAGNRPLTLQEIANLYDTTRAFRRRIDILCESGYFHKEGECYRLTGKGCFMSKGVAWLRKFYRVEEEA